ncbi:hypothetical protein CQA53_09035 [Helicobacter didelphidarum]|uniref:Outer membrane protein n=1 Tax=Helicobacter didelphidarum TaxID=2040648 RepID=A0A3D8IE81_9HELI|nr:hypothetical protein [Helicobacter didelphidarum]RDU62841.1 hypothetical protein CQA53_09035 [Helicobacter didelphidarum]
MKILKSSLFIATLGVGVSQALPLIDIEFGVVLSTDIKNVSSWNFNNDTEFTYGAYGRLWLKTGKVRVAPFIKWESIDTITANNALQTLVSGEPRTNNLQYGALFGVNLWIFTPYVGVAYSQFTGGSFDNTWALNYGINAKIPLVPISVGIDGSWQRPKIDGGVRANINRIGFNVGIQF